MRILGGSLKGRHLPVIDGSDIRPTSSRARETLFNMLEHRARTDDAYPALSGASVADLCCGSGALGLEALSRGAAHVLFIDRSKHALKAIESTAKQFGVHSQCSFLHSDIRRLPEKEKPCDYLLCDPPYRDAAALWQQLGDILPTSGWLHANSVMVMESAASEALDTPPFGRLDTDRRVGAARLWLFTCASHQSSTPQLTAC